MGQRKFQIKRIYDEPSEDDGYRVLVDRLWPRGVSREEARLDEWMKAVAPSTELRKWFDHEPNKFKDFKKRYETELAEKVNLVNELAEKADGRAVTLLYAAKDEVHNHAVVLRDFLEKATK